MNETLRVIAAGFYILGGAFWVWLGWLHLVEYRRLRRVERDADPEVRP